MIFAKANSDLSNYYFYKILPVTRLSGVHNTDKNM